MKLRTHFAPVRRRALHQMSTLLLFCAAAAASRAAGVPSEEADAIRATALDYVEGWYAGDAARMERALHPDLAKRQVVRPASAARARVEHMSALQLVQGTRAAFGAKTPAAEQRKDIVILDVFQNMAQVRADMRDWVDYMQLAKLGERWVIVNVLWELRTKPGEKK